MRINANLMAVNTHRQLFGSQTNGAKAMEKLSSGFRINRASDDAAGLAISEKMRSQIRGMKQASRNAQDGISVVQTAEGALDEIHSMLQRMKELAVQSASDSNQSVVDREALQLEVNALAHEIDSITEKTQFNKMTLLDGTFKNKQFHVGANQGETISVDIQAMTVQGIGLDKLNGTGEVTKTVVDKPAVEGVAAFKESTLTLSDFEAGTDTKKTATVTMKLKDGTTVSWTGVIASGKKMEIDDIVSALGKKFKDYVTVTKSGDNKLIYKAIDKGTQHNGVVFTGKATATLAGGVDYKDPTLKQQKVKDVEVSGVNILSRDQANASMARIQKSIETVASRRAELGAVQNRIEHTIKNLDNSHENLMAAESRVRHVDMAMEIIESTRNNILQQAATSMLAQANQAPQTVLSLLR